MCRRLKSGALYQQLADGNDELDPASYRSSLHRAYRSWLQSNGSMDEALPMDADADVERIARTLIDALPHPAEALAQLVEGRELAVLNYLTQVKEVDAERITRSSVSSTEPAAESAVVFELN